MTLYEFRRLLRKFYIQEKYDLIQADDELKLKTTWIEKINNNTALAVPQNIKLDVSFKLACTPKTVIIVPIEAITIDLQIDDTANPASNPSTSLHFEAIPLQVSLSFSGQLNSNRIVDLQNILVACKDVELTCTSISANAAVATAVPGLDFAKLFTTAAVEASKTKTLIAQLIAASKLTAQAESNSSSNITDAITDLNAFLNLSANILYEIELGYYDRNQQTLTDICEIQGYKKTIRDFTLGYKNK